MQSLIFFGSDRYSAIVLEQLLHSNLPGDSRQSTSRAYPDIWVVTDRQTPPSPIETIAQAQSLPYIYYQDLDPSWIPEGGTGLCASFDHLLPGSLISRFGGELYNLHPSLLPQYRNVSPVQYALALGDKETGITLFRISEGIDNGEIIAQTKETILPNDTTPTLTSRLFALGAQLFIDATTNGFTGQRIHVSTKNLVFTKRLTRDSGYVEWDVLHRLLKNEPISPSDTTNELLKLRLNQRTLLERNSRLPVEKGSATAERRVLDGTKILSDLLRALTPWPTVWSTVPTKKGDLRITLVISNPSHIPHSLFSVLISGKPKPISYNDFVQYYLNA